MTLKVFVSSTIVDLKPLRDVIRETLLDLGYDPVMSDYGDVGYLCNKSVEDSCYVAMSKCQIAVLIIGKRYGKKSQNNFSVTHNEFRTAREHQIPTISIIDQEVLSFKQVYDANIERNSDTEFSEMDAPMDTFSFVNEVMGYCINNGIVPYDTVTKAKEKLIKQIACMFGDLLTNQPDSIKVQIQRADINTAPSGFDLVNSIRFKVFLKSRNTFNNLNLGINREHTGSKCSPIRFKCQVLFFSLFLNIVEICFSS